MLPAAGSKRKFRKIIWDYYKAHGRSLPWRVRINPYRIVVSEVMLQQTQAERVAKKYPEFLRVFPSFASLADASFVNVLKTWQGLGYNRRALNLQRLAKIVVDEYAGKLPHDIATLESLPGIGKATARSIAAFALNQSAAFIETNIRRVYIHFFFSGKTKVHDAQILKLVEATLDKENPREWYYALMDYGTMLKTKIENPNHRSAHYRKQAKFEGSLRQVRGSILKMLLAGSVSKTQLSKSIIDKEKLEIALAQLTKEGFLTRQGKHYLLYPKLEK